jgi:hypothetical protein
VVLELKRAGVVLPNDVRVVERKHCLRVLALHRCPNTTDDLDVLLRHGPEYLAFVPPREGRLAPSVLCVLFALSERCLAGTRNIC